MTPRGIRNNNPGNIRKGRTLWQGEAAIQADPDFVTFTSPAYGIRAIAKIFLTYQGAGLRTLRQVASRWAPPSENDTAAYVDAVSHDVGVGPDQAISLRDPNRMIATIKAFVRHENGEQPYPDADYLQGVRLAGLYGPVTG